MALNCFLVCCTLDFSNTHIYIYKKTSKKGNEGGEQGEGGFSCQWCPWYLNMRTCHNNTVSICKSKAVRATVRVQQDGKNKGKILAQRPWKCCLSGLGKRLQSCK